LAVVESVGAKHTLREGFAYGRKGEA